MEGGEMMEGGEEKREPSLGTGLAGLCSAFGSILANAFQNRRPLFSFWLNIGQLVPKQKGFVQRVAQYRPTCSNQLQSSEPANQEFLVPVRYS